MKEIFWGTTDDNSYIDQNALQIIWEYDVDLYYIDKNICGNQGQMPNVYSDMNVFNQAFDYCIDVTNDLIHYCTPILNEVNGCSYKETEWKLYIFVWLYYFVSTLYDKYMKFKQMRSRYKNFYVIADGTVSILKETQSFQEQIIEAKFNVDLTAELMLYFGEDVYDIYGNKIEHLVWETDKYDGKCVKDYSNKKKKKTIFKLIKKVTNIRECRTFITAGGYLPVARIADYLSSGLIRSKDDNIYIITGKCKLDRAARKKLCLRLKTDDIFVNFVASIIGKYIPESVIEFFPMITQIATESYPQSASTIVDSVRFWCDEAFKRYIMERRSKGAEIRIVSHGGDGILRNYIERELADVFYTWGAVDRRCVCRPMPSGKLLSYSRKRIKPQNDGIILVVDYLQSKYIYRHWGGFTAAQKDFLESEIEFLTIIPNMVLEKVLLRPFPFDYGWDWKNRIKKRIPKIKIDDHRTSLFERLQSTSLVITTYFQTVWLETMYMGLPTIIVCSKELLPVMREAEEYIELLHSVNILIYSASEAATLVESIAGNEVAWWEDINRQCVVRSVLERFAYHPRNPSYLWLKELFCL